MSIIREFFADRLRVVVADSRADMGARAGDAAADCLRRLLSEKETVNVIFAAAPSQNETLARLAAAPGIDWRRVNAFHMDEYRGLPADAPQGFGNYLREHLFSRVPFGGVYYINGGAEPETECARYTALLRQYPVDMVCLGIGENGHIAFNDPWVADFGTDALIAEVPLDEVCRQQQVNDGCFSRIEEVPTHALSLTVPALMRAAHLICSVPAATKARAVAATVRSEISERVPATAMRRHQDATLFCEPESAALLTEEKDR